MEGSQKPACVVHERCPNSDGKVQVFFLEIEIEIRTVFLEVEREPRIARAQLEIHFLEKSESCKLRKVT